jgi:hypothetical protein
MPGGQAPEDEPLTANQETTNRKSALKFVLMTGVVSFFADLTYQGSRGITGPFLLILGG